MLTLRRLPAPAGLPFPRINAGLPLLRPRLPLATAAAATAAAAATGLPLLPLPPCPLQERKRAPPPPLPPAAALSTDSSGKLSLFSGTAAAPSRRATAWYSRAEADSEGANSVTRSSSSSSRLAAASSSSRPNDFMLLLALRAVDSGRPPAWRGCRVTGPRV